MKKTLFLQAPSYDGFDGGAGSRYQAKREIKSFWYPTWLAQPAALVPGSRLIDAPTDGLSIDTVLNIAKDYEVVIMHTSSPSFPSDVKFAEALKRINPDILIGMVGAAVAVSPNDSLAASEAIDWVGREEFDYTCKEVAEGRDLKDIVGLNYRSSTGEIIRNADRPMIENMDELPFVSEVYARDLTIENYFIGYLQHPYVSFYTGRGCRSKCTFCLWPQTVGGHRYRARSPESVIAEVAYIKRTMPHVKEIMFDDDTFTDFKPRVEEIARGLGKLGVTWSCNAKANVPYKTLKIMKENGLRLLLVGYESGNNQILHNIKKGLRTDIAREFTKNCRKLGIQIHGTFILGLPGETRETIQETIQFAREINPHTVQVSLAAPYPGTRLYNEAMENGWLQTTNAEDLVNDSGVQLSPISYPHLSSEEIFDSVETFYKKFYFRPSKIAELTGEMIRHPGIIGRRLREGKEFANFLTHRN